MNSKLRKHSPTLTFLFTIHSTTCKVTITATYLSITTFGLFPTLLLSKSYAYERQQKVSRTHQRIRFTLCKYVTNKKKIIKHMTCTHKVTELWVLWFWIMGSRVVYCIETNLSFLIVIDVCWLYLKWRIIVAEKITRNLFFSFFFFYCSFGLRLIALCAVTNWESTWNQTL